jgi:hypothetical protein
MDCGVPEPAMPELEISFHPKKEKSRKMRRRSRNKGQRKNRIWRQWISAERFSHAVLDI